MIRDGIAASKTTIDSLDWAAPRPGRSAQVGLSMIVCLCFTAPSSSSPANQCTDLQLRQFLKVAVHDLDVLRDGLVGHQLLLHTPNEDVHRARAHKLGGNLLHFFGPGCTARAGAGGARQRSGTLGGKCFTSFWARWHCKSRGRGSRDKGSGTLGLDVQCARAHQLGGNLLHFFGQRGTARGGARRAVGHRHRCSEVHS